MKFIYLLAIVLFVPKVVDGAKPNIIYLMLDEWGYYERSGAGHKKLQTPHIDKFVKESMQLTQCLAGASVCAPTRSVLMTGKHQGRTTVRANNGFAPLRENDITVASILQKAGYATGGFGKWGIGGRGSTGVPEKHGFDVFFGYYHQVHAHSFFPPYLIRNSEEIPLKGNKSGDYYHGKTHAQDEIFKASIEFIKANKENPFFCYLPWTPPHGLWGILEDDPSWQVFKDKKGWDYGQRRKEDARIYAALLHMVDRQIGEIIELIKDLGIDNNTIFFLSGDNGGQAYFSSTSHPHGFFGPNVDPISEKRIFRGGKGQMYEGGLRVPYFVRWPGEIKPNSQSNHLSSFQDVMATLCEIAQVQPAQETTGISFLPTLLGKKNQQQHIYLYWEQGKNYAVRMKNWKLLHLKNQVELYNLKTDLAELNNVADNHPGIVEKMTRYAKEAHQPAKLGTFHRTDLNQRDGQAAGRKSGRYKNPD